MASVVALGPDDFDGSNVKEELICGEDDSTDGK
jgi:hypothetical protein